MEWDLKMSPWDLPGLVQNACDSNLSSVVGSSGGLDCSVDLKLGGSADLDLTEKWKEQSRPLMMPVPPAKRPRLQGGSGQNVSCLVDGCKNDLSNCREYHRRHKVCEEHSKTPIVLVGGREQRFCQQCSRFHMLVEFDDVKRSCRKRLDGHNRRRRKPQMELTSFVNLANHHGTRFTSHPQTLRTAATYASWAAIGKREEEPHGSCLLPTVSFLGGVLQHPSQPIGHSPHWSFGEGKQFSFLPCDGTTESGGGKIVYSHGVSPVLNPDCALSLLSSSTQKSGICLENLVSMDWNPKGQSLLSRLQFGDVSATGFSCSGIKDDDVGTLLVSDGNEADLHCHSVFHLGSEDLFYGSSQSPLPYNIDEEIP